MSKTLALADKIYEQVRLLPEESLLELAEFVEFLQFKTHKPAAEGALRVVKLGGIMKGYDFSPEMLKEARREMWKKHAVRPRPVRSTCLF